LQFAVLAIGHILIASTFLRLAPPIFTRKFRGAGRLGGFGRWMAKVFGEAEALRTEGLEKRAQDGALL